MMSYFLDLNSWFCATVGIWRDLLLSWAVGRNHMGATKFGRYSWSHRFECMSVQFSVNIRSNVAECSQLAGSVASAQFQISIIIMRLHLLFSIEWRLCLSCGHHLLAQRYVMSTGVSSSSLLSPSPRAARVDFMPPIFYFKKASG